MKFRNIQNRIIIIIVTIQIWLQEIIQCRYIKSNQVEISSQQPIVYPDTSLINNGYQEKIETINFLSNFSKPPQILLGITYYDLETKDNVHIDFQVSVKEVQKTFFKVMIQKDFDEKIYALHLNYLAVESNDIYVVQDVFPFNDLIFSSSPEVKAKMTIPYKRLGIDSTKYERKISVFITGYKKEVRIPRVSNSYFSYQTEINYLSDNFELIFISKDLNPENILKQISFNYIEIYQDKINDYYRSDVFNVDQFKDVLSTSSLRNGNNNRTEKITQIIVNVDKIEGIFYGFTGVNSIINTQVLRLGIQNAELHYQATPTEKYSIDFEYLTWGGTKILTAQSDILVFAQKDCAFDNAFFSDSTQQCEIVCAIENFYKKTIIDPWYGNRKVCLPCDSTCKTCSEGGSNNCLTCANLGDYLFEGACYAVRPNNTYCNKTTKVCEKCALNDKNQVDCKECDDEITKKKCTLCQNNNYFLDDACYLTVPTNTFCLDKICQYCLGSCATCENSNKCLTCNSTNQFFYEDQCYPTQPQYTYCTPSNSICFKCNDDCKTCGSDLKCLTCKNKDYYLYKGECKQNKPEKTYCDLNNLCNDCNKDCKECSSDYKCIECFPSNPFLFQNTCMINQPDQTNCLEQQGSFYICASNQTDPQVCPQQCSLCKQQQICNTCEINLICLTCRNKDYFLYSGDCQQNKPDNTYCDTNKACNNCNKECKECSSDYKCTECFQSTPFLFQKTCLINQPDETNCLEQSDLFYICASNQTDPLICPEQCSLCNQSLACINCSNKFPYMYNKECIQNKPNKTYCDENKHCFDCHKSCGQCNGPKKNNCISCNENFNLQNQECICDTKKFSYNSSTYQCLIKESPFSEEQTKVIQEQTKTIGTTTVSMSAFFAITSGLTNSGSALLSQILTTQKIHYLLFVDIVYPEFLKEYLKTLSSGGVVNKFKILNIFTQFGLDTSKSDQESIGYKFQEEKFSSSIVKNSGGALIGLIIISIVQLISYLMTFSKFQDKIYPIYEKLISSSIIQFLQMIILVFFMSFIMQLIEYITNYQQSSSGTLIYMLMIICISTSIIIISYETHTLYNLQIFKVDRPIPSLISIFENKLANNCITESTSTRMYVVIFTLFECILFPACIILFRSTMDFSIVSLIVIQLLEFMITAHLRPFYSKLDNIQYIFEQFVWFVIFILICVLCQLLGQMNIESTTYSSSIIVICMTVMALILVAILLSPLFQIIQMILMLVKFIRQYRSRKMKKKSSYSLDLSLTIETPTYDKIQRIEMGHFNRIQTTNIN